MPNQKPSIFPVQWSPGKGGLKSDIDPKNVNNGDLLVTGVDTGGLNIRAVGKGLNVSPDYEPMGGNEEVYRIPVPSVQNKIFRIYLNILDISNTSVNFECNLNLTTPTGNYVAPDSATAPFVPGTFTATNILTQVETDLLAAFAVVTPTTSITTINSSEAYLQVEFPTVDHFDWQLQNTLSVAENYSFDINVYQEAIDRTMTGYWNLIGSDDKIGDDFKFYTTRRGLARTIDVFSISAVGSVATITTAVDHDLTAGDSVNISLVVGATEVNGDWIISNVTATSFDIEAYVPVSAYISGGVVSTNIYGYGQIGVAVEDDAGAITYTRLIQSREFNFSTEKQIDVRVKRKQDSSIASYFTDAYNEPRVFYYKGAYATDGGLSENGGRYEYGSISDEMRWILSDSGFGISFSSQAQGGGSLYAGNWRYAVRWLTSEFVGTEWSPLTNPVPVFSYDYTTGQYTIGDAENTVTPKINILELNNAIPGIFTYAEIAAVNYVGASLQAYIIGRYPLNGIQTQLISHTGNESGIINLDAGQLNETFPGFIKAQNVELLDNRAILTNLTPAQVVDFSAWVDTFLYSLERDTIDPVGVYTTSSATLFTGEYQDPATVHSKMTHMFFETYRYGFRFKLKNGRMTDVFYYDDIRIDLPTTLPPKRTAGSFTSFDLTDVGTAGVPNDVYSIYINFYNFDLNFKIDGVFAKDLVEEIIPVRAEVIPEVLAMGMGVLGVAGNLVTVVPPGPGVGTYTLWFSDINSTNLANSYRGPFPWISGNGLPALIYGGATGIVSGPNPQYDNATNNWANLGPPDGVYPDSSFLYSPDILWNHIAISDRPGDQLLVFGAPERHSRYDTGPGAFPGGANGWDGSYSEYNGYTNHTTNADVDVYSVSDSVFAPRGIGKIMCGGTEHSLNLIFQDSTGPDAAEQFPNERCQIVFTSSDVANNTAQPNYGALLMMYYRPLTDKYGDPSGTKYQHVGVKLNINGFTGVIGSGNLDTYGDCFNQKTYLKQRYPAANGYWFGMGVAFYSINRINAQLKRKRFDTDDEADLVPRVFIGDSSASSEGWLKGPYTSATTINEEIDPQLAYNEGYTPRNTIQYFAPFNPNLQYQTDWGNAIAWSDIETEGSNSDNLRTFPPLNLKFLDYTQGVITDARALNGELITIQPREVQRQYFNTTSMINTTDGSEVVLGDGSVLQRRGQTMTRFGSQHKWSIVMGRSDRGHDVLYGFDDINKAIWRIGYDGTTPLDEINGIKSFIANNIQWVKGKYTPANGEGVCAVANQRYREVIWSFSGSSALSAVAPEWVENEISGNLIEPFESNLGQNLIQNPLFAGDTSTPTVIPGWTAAVGGANGWQLYAGTGVASVIRQSALGVNDILRQTAGITFTTGSTYLVKVVVTSVSPNPLVPVPLGIKFDTGIPAQFYTITTPGTYYFTYTAPGGTEDNIYINGPGLTYNRIQEVSMWEITSGSNWSGSPTWLLTALGATCGAGVDDLAMAVPPQSYLVQFREHTLMYSIADYASGMVVAYIGDQADTPRNSNGSWTFTATPGNINPVVRFESVAGLFRGRITQSIYLSSSTPKYYSVGDVVSVYNPTFSGDYQIYICTEANTGKYPPSWSDPSPDAESYWRLVPTTDPNYYTRYAIVFSELKNEFQSFHTPKPRIYSKFLDKYFVPRPLGDTGIVYLSDSGTEGVWFDDGSTRLESSAYFDAVINSPEGRKSFIAIRVESETVPDQVRVYTNQHETYMEPADFEQREGNEFDAPVMNDILTAPNGTPSENTSTLYGDYAIFRFIINSGAYNRFNSFIAKARIRARQLMR